MARQWDLINTPMGYWYLVEMIGFVLLPMALFFYSYRRNNIFLIKAAAVLTMIGIIINRLNVTVIGFKWDRGNQVCAHMDGINSNTCSNIYGNMDFQMGDKPDACIKGIAFMGE